MTEFWKQRRVRVRGASGGFGSYLFDSLFMAETSYNFYAIDFFSYSGVLFCFDPRVECKL